MATALASPPTPKTSALRRWFPLLAVALCAAAIAVVWNLPEGTLDRMYRSMANFGIVSAVLLAFVVWLFFFAPFRRAERLACLGALALLLAGFVLSVWAGLLEVDNDGDMVQFIYLPRWFPVLALEVALVALAAVWCLPGGATERPFRAIGSFAAVGLAGLAVLGWVLVFAPFRRPLPEGTNSNLAAAADLSGNGPTDWAEYRGSRRDGVVTGPALATDWSGRQPLWKHNVGAGHGSFAVAGDLAFTLEQRGNEEAVVCYHVPTGEQVWVHTYPALFNEALGGKGPRSTPTVRDGEVYALGAAGKLVCLDGRTGKAKWAADVLEHNANAKWGMTGSPLVLEDVVVVNPGTQTEQAAGTLAAYDRKTGQRQWVSGRGTSGYSSPTLATLGGKRQILLLDGEGFAGYDPADKGKQLWRYPWPVQENINVAQPVVLGDDQVFISSGYGVGGAALRVKHEGGKWAVEPLWRTRKMRCKFTSPVLYQGHLYGLDEGVLACVSAADGSLKWRGERYGHGQVLLTNGQLVITSEDGALALVEATPQGYRELTRLQAVEGRTWNLPALANGRALVRNHLEAACYDLRAR